MRDTTGDPWDGRSLEWATASPPASYNFTVIPKVTSRDAYWEMKKQGLPERQYEDIVVPKNTGSGIYIAIFAFLASFAFVWEIVWLVIVSLLGVIVFAIMRTFDERVEYTVTAAEVKRLEEERLKKAEASSASKADDMADDMGLREFVKIVLTWALGFIRGKRWRSR